MKFFFVHLNGDYIFWDNTYTATHNYYTQVRLGLGRDKWFTFLLCLSLHLWIHKKKYFAWMQFVHGRERRK